MVTGGIVGVSMAVKILMEPLMVIRGIMSVIRIETTTMAIGRDRALGVAVVEDEVSVKEGH